MTTRKLDKAQWRGFLDHMSKLLEEKRTEVEVASPNLGDQIEAEWVPIIGVTYDPKDDLIDVELEGLDHMIHKPRELYVENGVGVARLGIVDADGRQADREVQGSDDAASAAAAIGRERPRWRGLPCGRRPD